MSEATADIDAAAGNGTIHPEAVAFDPPVDAPQRRIGLLYGGTGIALFLLMVIVGILMRLTQADALPINDDWFYRLMTLHAAGILTGVLMAMMGGLWYVVRSSVPELDFPRAIGAYGAIMAGVVLVLVAVLIGGFAGAWTFLWPLPFKSAGAWSQWAAVTFLVGMVLVGVGWVVYCVDVLKALTDRYRGFLGALGIKWLFGRAEAPPPPQILAGTAVAIQGIIAGAVGMTILIALIDHALDNSIVLDALWAKNLTYFFGHTLANLVVYLAAGMLYVLVPLYAGRQWKTSKPLVVGWMGTIAFVLTAYAHHLYMDFVQPQGLDVMGLVASSAAAIPVAVVTIYTAMMLVWGSKYRWNLTSVLLFIGFAGWAIGGAGAVIDSSIPVNFHLHNTLWVPAHFHNYMLMGTGMWALALVSYLLERASDSPVRKPWSVLSPVLMVVGGYGLIYVWYFSGALGIPRRWAGHPEGTEGWSLAGSLFAILLLVGMLILIVEFIRMGRIAWARRNEQRPQAPAAAAAGGGLPTVAPEPIPVIGTQRSLVVTVALGIAALFAFYPPLNEAAEVGVKYHHLIHAVQFLAGSLLGVAIGSAPRVLRRFPGGLNGGLIVALVAPVVMLLLMIPMIYSDLLESGPLHGSYHLIMVALGLLTGLGASLLGRVAGWAVVLTSVGMALLFAPGVGV